MRVGVICFLVLLGPVWGTGWGQEASPSGGAEVSSWWMYFGDHAVSARGSLHVEVQARRTGAGERWEQLLLRPGYGYKLPHGMALLGGYTYYRSSPFEGGSLGAKTTTGPQPEHQIFEQFSVEHRVGPEGPHTVKLTHRFRDEQRFQGTATRGVGVTDWEFTGRARYRLTADVPLNTRLGTFYPNYVSVYNEVFTQYGSHAKRVLDQDWTYAALGFNLNRTTQLEVGYLRQYSPVPNGVVGVGNDVFQFSISSTAPFRRGVGAGRRK